VKQIAIKKSGNSVTVRIPSGILKALSLNVNDPVNIDMMNGCIVLTPVNPDEPTEKAEAKEDGSLAERLRVHLGLTQQGMADYFGLTLSAWQKKEMGVNRLSVAEQQYFELLLKQPPKLFAVRHTEDNSPLQRAATASSELAVYMSGRLVLPSKANELLTALNECMREYSEEWKAELEHSVGNALPDEAEILRLKLEEAQAEIRDLKKRLTKA